MSAKLMGQVLKIGLKRSELLVLVDLAEHPRDDGTGARPGVVPLAWKTAMSSRDVVRALKTLTGRGLIQRISGGGQGRATEYQILIAACPAKASQWLA